MNLLSSQETCGPMQLSTAHTSQEHSQEHRDAIEYVPLCLGIEICLSCHSLVPFDRLIDQLIIRDQLSFGSVYLKQGRRRIRAWRLCA